MTGYPKDGETMSGESLRKQLARRTLPVWVWNSKRKRRAIVVWRREPIRRGRSVHGLWWPMYNAAGRCIGYKYQKDKKG